MSSAIILMGFALFVSVCAVFHFYNEAEGNAAAARVEVGRLENKVASLEKDRRLIEYLTTQRVGRLVRSGVDISNDEEVQKALRQALRYVNYEEVSLKTDLSSRLCEKGCGCCCRRFCREEQHLRSLHTLAKQRMIHGFNERLHNIAALLGYAIDEIHYPSGYVGHQLCPCPEEGLLAYAKHKFGVTQSEEPPHES